MVYPGASYGRSVHVLLAYELARRFIIRLHNNSLFRFLFDQDAMRQALAVVLLHDINHFPFLHVLQESGIAKITKTDLLDLFCDGELTGEKAGGRPSIYQLVEGLGLDPLRLKRILFQPHEKQLTDVDCVIRSLIDSGVDVDKLSYLRLDAHCTGVPFGLGMDVARILEEATLGELVDDDDDIHRPHLAFHEGAFQALENVVMTRFWNFRALYWHHTNRAVMAMLLRVARRVYGEGDATFDSYLRATMWGGEIAGVKYLAKQYQEKFKVRSIVDGLPEDRVKIFRRLYTVRTGRRDAPDTELYERCKNLGLEDELGLSRQIGQELEKLLGLANSAIGVDEVLIDVPRRRLDSGGEVYIRERGTRLRALSDESEPIRAVIRNYDKLTQTIRCYISPRIAAQLKERFGEHFREEQREKFRTIIDEALREKAGAGQVH